MSLSIIYLSMIWWAIVFKAIEYIASIITFKLFIYEEICQSGNMQLYIHSNSNTKKPVGPIIQKLYKYAYNPAMNCIELEGFFCPWASDVFGLYFKAEKYYIRTYGG